MVKMKKAQGAMVIIVGVFFIIGIFVLAAFILNSVKEVEEEVINTLDPNTNATQVSDEDFGEPMPGDNIKEKHNKAKDPEIAPPELSG
jgi:hypothetical protein